MQTGLVKCYSFSLTLHYEAVVTNKRVLFDYVCCSIDDSEL